ncbi:MAG: T9SS type A sorting domain-containing protein [Candidatus Marinimicrobia bacterium]|nr:T9SS type A sorting domain-containing protein [Candidatus Neomarinimicrobiota bacterium]
MLKKIVVLIVGLCALGFAEEIPVGNEFPIEISDEQTFAMSFAEDADKYVIVMRRESETSGADIVAQFHSKTDHSLIGNPIVLGSTVIPPEDFDLGFIQVAFDGERFLVVWTNGENGGIQYRFIHAQTYELSNTFSDTTLPAYLNTNALHFNLSLNKYLLISSIKQPSGHYIIKNFIHIDGFLESSSPIFSFPTRKENCTAFGDSKYLIASIKEVSGYSDYEVWGRFIHQDGSNIGSEFLIDGSNYPSDNPIFVMYVDGKFICIFPDEESTGWKLYARIVNTDGTVQPERYLISNFGWLSPFMILGDNSMLVTSTSVNPNPDSCFVLGKFFDFSLNPIGDEFIIYDQLNGKVPVSGVGSYGNNKFYVYTNRVDIAFTPDSSIYFSNGDVYGVSVDALTGVDDYVIIPEKIELYQNFPNPFNPSTKISWQSSVNSHQTLKVYDVLGNEVATLVDEYRLAGNYEIDFDASNLSSGIYFYCLKTGNLIEARKMILFK